MLSFATLYCCLLYPILPLLVSFSGPLWSPSHGQSAEVVGHDHNIKMIISLECFLEVVLLFLLVLPLLCNAPGAVVKAPYCTPLHMCWMVRPKVAGTCPYVSVYLLADMCIGRISHQSIRVLMCLDAFLMSQRHLNELRSPQASGENLPPTIIRLLLSWYRDQSPGIKPSFSF